MRVVQVPGHGHDLCVLVPILEMLRHGSLGGEPGHALLARERFERTVHGLVALHALSVEERLHTHRTPDAVPGFDATFVRQPV